MHGFCFKCKDINKIRVDIMRVIGTSEYGMVIANCNLNASISIHPRGEYPTPDPQALQGHASVTVPLHSAATPLNFKIFSTLNTR